MDSKNRLNRQMEFVRGKRKINLNPRNVNKKVRRKNTKKKKERVKKKRRVRENEPRGPRLHQFI